MTEQMLVDLIGDIDVSLLNNQYLEKDMRLLKRKNPKVRWNHSIFRKGTVFTIHDSLQNAVNEQRELIDTVIAHPYNEEPHFTQKIETKVKAVKKKLHTAIAIASGIAAMVILAVSVIVVIAKKKTLAKIFSKRVQTA